MSIPDDMTAADKTALCRQEYVAKQCDAKVADQKSPNAARKADELKRKLEREADERTRNASRMILIPEDMTAHAKIALCGSEHAEERQCDAWVADQKAWSAAQNAYELE